MNNLDENLSFIELPCLDEILRYLPISARDKEDVDVYLSSISDLVRLNYKYGQYQFAYFGLHLLYMTYIYFTVWKISKIIPDRYTDAVVFARAYAGRDLNFLSVESIFEYSMVPEKELPKIFRIIDLNEGQIGIIAGLVDTRNDMAHASGKFEILNEESFMLKVNSVCSSIRNIHNAMDDLIRSWFRGILLQFCEGKYGDYSDLNDFIFEQMIQNFNLSINELLICDEMSLRGILKDNPDQKNCLKGFKRALEAYCKNNDYSW